MTSALSSVVAPAPRSASPNVWDDAPTGLDLHASIQWCRGLARAHAHRIPGIRTLLERSRADEASTVFAFVQRAHDFVKAPRYEGHRVHALAWWEDMLTDAYHGRAEHPAFVALAHVSKALNIPITDFRAFLNAQRLEVVQPRFETWSELERYVGQMSEPIGHLVLRVMGHDDPRLLRLSSPFSVGLHLVDIVCDLRRDLLAGRLYVPTEDLSFFGIRPSEIATSPSSPAVRDLVAFQASRAKTFLMRGRPLVREAPEPASRVIMGLWRVALERLRELEPGLD